MIEGLVFKKHSKKESLRQKLEETFNPKQAFVLADVITDAYDELVKTGDFNELKSIVKQLAEAQTEMRQSLKVLADAQTEMRQALQKLAEAEMETKQELKELAREHKETRRQLGGLTITVGYTLENKAYVALPQLLKRDYGIAVTSEINRQYVQDNQGQEIEINIIGQAERNGKNITLIGESKSQLSVNGVNDFIRKKLTRLDKVYDEIFPILVAHMTTSSDVEAYAKSKGIALYYSYQF
jgi:hypothetical protein